MKEQANILKKISVYGIEIFRHTRITDNEVVYCFKNVRNIDYPCMSVLGKHGNKFTETAQLESDLYINGAKEILILSIINLLILDKIRLNIITDNKKFFNGKFFVDCSEYYLTIVDNSICTDGFSNVILKALKEQEQMSLQVQKLKKLISLINNYYLGKELLEFPFKAFLYEVLNPVVKVTCWADISIRKIKHLESYDYTISLEKERKRELFYDYEYLTNKMSEVRNANLHFDDFFKKLEQSFVNDIQKRIPSNTD